MSKLDDDTDNNKARHRGDEWLPFRISKHAGCN